MSLSNWMRKRFGAESPGSVRQAEFRPRLEVLEERAVPATAILVANIMAGMGSSIPDDFVDVGGTLFFSANDGTNGVELWKSDGTSLGTLLVKDINPMAGSSSPNLLTNVGGTLFFQANDGTNGIELWKSDGTSLGTLLVSDINIPGNSNPFFLTNVGGTLFFQANDGTNGIELWKSNGTSAGTLLVSDINIAGSSDPVFLTNVGGTLFFRADDGANGRELWKSNGTSAGTLLVSDIYPGPSSSYPFPLTNVGGTLFFQAVDGTYGYELWKSDGTSLGTVLVKDIAPLGYSSYPYSLTNVGGTLFFTADDGTYGIELWKSNGTSIGTVLVKDVYPGVYGSYPYGLTNVGGTLFFSANDGADGYELWKSDGSSAGTLLVKNIGPGGDSYPFFLTNVAGTLFFRAVDGTYGYELWKSDGTSAGTLLVKDIMPGGAGSYPFSLANVGGTLFFSANDGINGYELWRTIPDADLAVTKTNGVMSVTAGMPTTYMITVSSAGPDPVTGAILTDTFPAALTGVTFTSTGFGGATGNTAAGIGNIADTLNLPVGSSVTYTVTGTVDPAATGMLSNTATIALPATVVDLVPGNNSFTDTDTIDVVGDLSISKTNGTSSVTSGSSTTYTITVINAGPSTVAGATITDMFPAILTGVSFTSVAAGGASGNTAVGTGNILDMVTLPSMSSITYTVTGTVDPAATGTLSNTATVSAPVGTTDPVPGNNTATDTDSINPATTVTLAADGTLSIIGSCPGDDDLRITQVDATTVNIVANTVDLGNFSVVSRIVVNTDCGDDVVQILNVPAVPVSIDGGDGDDVLDLSATAERITFFINDPDPNFRSIETLIGGPANDTFVFLPGSDITGTVAGMGGIDILDFSRLGRALTVNFGTGTANGLVFSGIETAIGTLFEPNVFIPASSGILPSLASHHGGGDGPSAGGSSASHSTSDLDERRHLTNGGGVPATASEAPAEAPSVEEGDTPATADGQVLLDAAVIDLIFAEV